MDELERSAALLKEALDEMRKTSMVSAATFDKLNKSIEANTKAIDANKKNQQAFAQETEEAAQRIKELKESAKQITRQYLESAQAARENREDFRSLNPAIRATGAIMGSVVARLGSGISAVGEVISGLGALIPRVGTIVSAFGKGISSAGSAVKKHGKDAVDAATKFMEFSTGEIQRVVGAYKELGSVGGITAGGMRDLQNAAIRAGLSVDQYSRVISKNAQSLASAGVTVAGGADALGRITDASKQFEDQFLALGIGFEQQREYTAKFLENNRMVGRIQIRDTQALSEANRNYLMILDEVSRLTGKSRDQVANEYEAQTRDVRFGATLAIANMRDQTGRLSGEIKKVADVLGVQGSKELQDGFQDIFGGPTTQRAKELEIATGGAASRIAAALESGAITSDQALQQLQESIRTTYQQLGAEEFQRRVGKLGTVLEPALVGMMRFSKATDLTAEAVGKAKKEQEGATKIGNEETKRVIDAQKALRDFAVQLDKIVVDRLFPTMAKSVQFFTKTLVDGAGLIAKVLGVKTEAPPGVSTNQGQRPAYASTAAGAPRGATPTSDDYLERLKQLESGGRNIQTQIKGKDGKPASEAFGLYQITPRTFKSLVANAAPGNPLRGKTFEDMKADVDLQTEAVRQLTDSNARLLARGGHSTSDAAKYMAHVLGYGEASRVLGANLNLPIEKVVSATAISNNPKLFENVATVGDLRKRFSDVTGGAGYQYGGIASGPKSGYATMLHGTEAVIPLPGNRQIPVEMTGMTDKIGEQLSVMKDQISRLDQMVALMQTNTDISRNILRATTA